VIETRLLIMKDIVEGSIVKYRDCHGTLAKGKVVSILTSTVGIKFVCIDNFANRVRLSRVEVVS
jgi:hypothetical protein